METTQTVSAIDVARDRLDFQAELVTVIEEESRYLTGVDDFNPFSIGLWTYSEPDHVRGLSPAVRRTWALEWLATHARLIQRVVKRMGHDGPVIKGESDYLGFGVQVHVRRSTYISADLHAFVPSDLTCEMVPTGEIEHIPARDVPVMERRCPESIFRGIEQEVTV